MAGDPSLGFRKSNLGSRKPMVCGNSKWVSGNKLGDLFDLFRICHGILKFLFLIISLKWRIKAWGQIAIRFLDIFGTFKKDVSHR